MNCGLIAKVPIELDLSVKQKGSDRQIGTFHTSPKVELYSAELYSALLLSDELEICSASGQSSATSNSKSLMRGT